MNPEPGEFALSMWLISTIGHFGLTAYWVRRFHLAGSSRDEFWFVSMLAATGTLALVLHVVAASVGLGLASVLVPLAAVHGVLAAITSRRPRPAPPPPYELDDHTCMANPCTRRRGHHCLIGHGLGLADGRLPDA